MNAAQHNALIVNGLYDRFTAFKRRGGIVEARELLAFARMHSGAFNRHEWLRGNDWDRACKLAGNGTLGIYA